MRVKRGTTHARKRTRLFKQTKGYRWGRKNRVRLAKTAILKAGVHAFRDRRKKKRVFRRQWQVQLNAAVRPHKLSYSHFIAALKTHNIALDRKVLADLAEHEPAAFQAILDAVKRPR